MPALASTASARVHIFTKAWRFSWFTMQVWTRPNRLNIWRSSLSLQLEHNVSHYTRQGMC